VLAVVEPGMQNRTIPLSGPEAMAANQAVKVFEEVTGKTFKVQRLPRGIFVFMAAVTRPFNGPLSTIMTLASSNIEDRIDITTVLEEFPVQLTSVRDFAERAAASS